MNMNRRSFVTGALALPLISAASPVSAQASVPRVGDSKEAFEAWLGAGTASGPYTQYQPIAAGRASYAVEYGEDGLAHSVLGDFQQLAGGGITFDEAEAGTSQFLRDDAMEVMAFNTMGLLARGWLAVRVWHSPSLATDLSGSGIVTVLDRVVPGPNGPMGDMLFGETMVAMERAEVHPVVPNGSKPGPHSSEADWERFYPNGLSPAQTGIVVRDPDYAADILMNDWGADIPNTSRAHFYINEAPIPTTESAQIVSDHLPESRLVSTTWYHAGPNYGNGFRLHHFEAQGTGIHFLSVQEVLGDEQDGLVTGIHLCPMAS